MSRPGAKERARLYITSPKTPRAIAGQGGDKTTYAVACTLAVDFGLDDSDVLELLGTYNATKCEPKWPGRDIERFVRSARRTANGKPGEIGKLLNVDRENYTGPRSPTNNPEPRAATKPAAKPAHGGSPATGDPPRTARTARTPFFTVRRAGEGAEPRTARTVRTLPVHSFPISSPLPSPHIEESKKVVSEKSDPTKPATIVVAASKPAPKRVPVEPVDVTTVWANGEVWRKPWRGEETFIGNYNHRTNRA